MPSRCVCVQRKHIETAVTVGEIGMMVEKSLCACNDFLLLACADAGGSPTETWMVAQAYFRKHEQRLLLHDEVNLAEPAAIVGADQAKALRQEKITGGIFSRLSVLLRESPCFCCRETRAGWQRHC